jgi:uncharacterized protein YndB with AHSA1/START domain
MIDVTHQINAVRRQVGMRVLEAGEARTVTVSQTYRSPIDDVWDACTNAERIARWFLPISGDLHAGGHYKLEGNAEGTVERCEPPKSFAATWEYGGEVSWIEVRLSVDPGGGTRFELEHTVPIDDERWAEFGPGAVGVGWDMGLMGLAGHLSSGAVVDPEQSAAWAASQPGTQFVSLSSERWSEASVSAGTDTRAAQAAADRTTAAYTASGPDREPSPS